MTVHEQTIDKIQRMPEPLVQEVANYVDFLLTRSDGERWQSWLQFSETLEMAESDMTDYRRNLEDYEERLARGEVRW